MWIDIIVFRLLISICLSFLLWLEREFNNQPAWLRTHILIWLWASLLMILSIKVAWMPGNINWDPWRIAAQVVSWIWFIWAWAIMRTWLWTKWLTTAANIWATAAIWLLIWAWMYWVWIIATIFILFNLIIITKFKKKLIKQIRYCNICIEFEKNKKIEKKVIEKFEKLPIKIKTQDIKENNSSLTVKIVWKLNKDIEIYTLKNEISQLKNIKFISISENFK